MARQIPREPGRSVSSRLLRLLAAFRPGDGALTLAQLCWRTGLPPATAHRLLQELLAWGALERSDGASYRMGLRMFEIGMLAHVQQGLGHTALPFMQDLYEVTGENVHLAVLNEQDRLIFIGKIGGRRSVPSSPPAGGSLLAHATASGRILLAYSTPDVLERVIDRGLGRYTAYTVDSPAALRRSLAAVRNRGYAVCNQEVRTGNISIAAPVRDQSNQVVAAVSVVGRCTLDLRKATRAVRANALAISRQLGAPSATEAVTARNA